MAGIGALIGICAAGPSAVAAAAGPAAGKPVLSVCADPNNLPFSNQRQEGFENRIAVLLARDMQTELQYFWFPQHRNFLRKTLLSDACDVLITIPAGLPMLATTRPYFTSTYVVVTRANAKHQFSSFDDAWLGQAKIGLQLVGAEGASTPPAASLARRGDDGHVTFFPMWAAPGVESPQGRIIDAVADGTIDAAFVWGPFGGYFAKPHAGALRLLPVTADAELPDQSFTFAMAMGTRKDEIPLRDRLQDAIDRHGTEITAILRAYGVPVVTGDNGEKRPMSPPATH